MSKLMSTPNIDCLSRKQRHKYCLCYGDGFIAFLSVDWNILLKSQLGALCILYIINTFFFTMYLWHFVSSSIRVNERECTVSMVTIDLINGILLLWGLSIVTFTAGMSTHWIQYGVGASIMCMRCKEDQARRARERFPGVGISAILACEAFSMSLLLSGCLSFKTRWDEKYISGSEHPIAIGPLLAVSYCLTSLWEGWAHRKF